MTAGTNVHDEIQPLDPERRSALQDDFIAFHEGFRTELGICVPRDYWLTVGDRK